ncbi:Tenascin [Heterostelium album PN500]|uniref:Tenascin n=1 Tax=Heterostelium pallidum (strain ATCC 26659 / Pp 5 / PN500) TaxID=670386 RepID=D3B8N5_HETP5|nr:Tenascin [Heterostelium album PN500]EFA82403.1 Tenascin [Heterostelium album PN500]|eukprot:XP_020434520.1 Tenascin [Heterostelium album PN500]
MFSFKILYLLLLYLYVANSTLASNELNSIRFLIQQYQLGVLNLTATDCNGIQNNAPSPFIRCIIDSNSSKESIQSIKLLKATALTNVPVSLYLSPMKDISLQLPETSTFINSLDFNPGQDFSTLESMSIGSVSFGSKTIVDFNQSQFPKLQTLSITSSKSQNQVQLNLNSEKLAIFTLNFTNFTPTDLSIFPSLSTINNKCLQYKKLGDQFLETNKIIDNQLDGSLPNYPTYPSYFFVGEKGITGVVPEAACNSYYLYLTGTSVTSVPDYSTVYNPFIVRKSIHDNLIYNGKNLGYGYPNDIDPNLNFVLYNTKFKYNSQNKTGNLQNVQFSKLFRVFMNLSWVTDVTEVKQVSIVQLPYKLNITVYGIFDPTYSYEVLVNGNNICKVQNMSTYINCFMMGSFNDESNYLVGANSSYLIESINTFYKKDYPIVSSVLPIPTSGGKVVFYGNFGTFGQTNPLIKINNQNCIIINKSSTVLECNIGQSSEGVASLLISVDGYTFSSNTLLKIYKDEEERINCGYKNNCNSNGNCTNGSCQCNLGFLGQFCEFSETFNGTININTTSPVLGINAKDHQFEFSMVAIQEVDQLSNVVAEVLTENWRYNQTLENKITTLSYFLNSTNTTIQVKTTIQYSAEQWIAEFAGINTTILPNSLKLSSYLSGWQYQSNLNTIRFVFTTTLGDFDRDCNGEFSPVGSNQLDQSVEYLKVIKDGITFYGKFLDRSISDGRVAFSRNIVINQTENGNVFIAVEMPQCQTCEIDPNFSLLLNPNVEGCDSKSKLWWIILVSCVCGVIFIGLSMIGIFYLRKKKHTIKLIMMSKLDKIKS